MKVGTWFWVIWVIALLFGGYVGWNHAGGFIYWFGGSGLMMILTFFLGLGIFGSPIQGGSGTGG